MFRLENRQLHILIGLLSVASFVLFFIFCGTNMKKQTRLTDFQGMTDFSEAWICNFKGEGEEESKTEIRNFPSEFSIKKGSVVTMTHKVPELGLQTKYLLFETEHQSVKVFADESLIYSSKDRDKNIHSFHKIPILRDYKDMIIRIELTQESNPPMRIGTIQVGTYNELVVQAFLENGLFFVVGIFCIIMSIAILFLYVFITGIDYKKRLLLYGSLEGLLFGSILLTESDWIPILLNWNYELYFVKVCLAVLIIIFHVMIIRHFVYKKKVLFLLDIGILLQVIFYISAMVFQAFSLVQFDILYQIAVGMFLLYLCFYTISLAITIFDYNQKQGKIILIANGILILSILVQGIGLVTDRQNNIQYIYILFGFLLYFLLLWVYGMKQACFKETEKEKKENPDQAIRTEMIEQLNPNLLFLSFRTLQNLIKNGSSNSMKMIYYISVYLRGNLKVFEQGNEIITFEEELEHILAYLQLQKIRNQNLVFALECKEKDFRIPRHTIEPLVENAVKHGFANQDQKGNVVIRTYQRREGYAIQIIDDGIGVEKDTSVLNIFQMLEQICGAKTEKITKEGKGTVITIILPMLENDLMAKE